METLKVFNKKKEDIFKMLDNLLLVLKEGKELGVDIEPEYITKIEKSIDENEDKKLKVVLIGGFSEGKTSIAAAWLEEYDKNKMKIAMTESTDDIREYNIGNINLVDTPGLFGFKETANKEKYKDITKKYISEANIVLYVMNSDNPIKESHKEEIQWLFKDLNLLPRTVFILSRFDNVADIEDDNDYNGMLKIKKENILKRLKDFEVINAEESHKLPIVAVAANPFDEGIEYWLGKLDEFKKISHIDSLQNATSDIVKKNGGVDSVLLETQKSIIKEILELKIPLATVKLEKLDKDNRIEWSKNGVPRIIKYADEHNGEKIQDIWKDFKDPQYPDYPTQKNFDMLELIIKQSSNENSIIMDCFAGSASFLEMGLKNNRFVIGIDNSDIAYKLLLSNQNLQKIEVIIQDKKNNEKQFKQMNLFKEEIIERD